MRYESPAGPAAAVLLALVTANAPAADVSAGWTHRAPIRCTGYTGSETLTNFPLLVRVSPSAIPGFRYADARAPGGADLRFADAGRTTELSREVERWDTNGESCVWVRLPRLASSNELLWAFWGNPGAAAPPDGTNGAVWSGGYAAVWHLSEGGVGRRHDATSNRNHGTPALYNGDEATNGIIGGADSFDGARPNNADRIDVPDSDSLDATNRLTLESWIKADSFPYWSEIIAKYLPVTNNACYQYRVTATAQIEIWLATNQFTTPATVSTGRWSHLVLTFDRPDLVLYLNGRSVYRTNRNSNIPAGSSNLTIGAHGDPQPGDFGFDGIIDEARVSTAARSSNYVWACWSNQTIGSSFLSFGPTEPIPRTAGGLIRVR